MDARARTSSVLFFALLAGLYSAADATESMPVPMNIFGSHNFDLGNRAYLNRLIMFSAPGLLLAAGAFIGGIVYFTCSCFFGKCNKNGKLKRDESSNTINYSEVGEPNNNYTESEVKTLRFIIIGIAVVALAAGGLGWAGNARLDGALNKGVQVLDDVVTNYSISVTDARTAYLDANPNPSPADPAYQTLKSLSALNGAKKIVATARVKATAASATYLTIFRSIVLLSLLLVGVALAAAFTKTLSALSQAAAYFACLVLTLIWIVFTFHLLYVVAAGDACPNMDSALAKHVSPSMQTELKYYLTCTGPGGKPGASPQVAAELHAKSVLASAEAALAAEQAKMPQNGAAVKALQTSVARYRVVVSSITLLSDCTEFKTAYEGFQFRVCDTGYSGALQAMAALLLLGLLFPALIWALDEGAKRFREFDPADRFEDPVHA